MFFFPFRSSAIRASDHASRDNGALARFLGSGCILNNGWPSKRVRAWSL
jgi:hypothetical protein